MKSKLVTFFILLFLFFFTNTPFILASKKPMVAIRPIKCESQKYGYLGKAITEMLITRLSSEGIDSFVILDKDKEKEVLEVSDFLVEGVIHEKEKALNAEFILKKPDTGRLLKRWKIISPNLESLARETSLFTAKLSDNIKNAEDVLGTFSDFAETTQKNSQSPMKDEFQMARMHPDVLVRENLERDEAKEIEKENKRIQEEKKLQEEQETSEAVEEDDENFMPIPDVYNPEDDEMPEERPVKKVNKAQKDQDEASIQNESSGEKSWYSWLWPFGSSKEKEEAPEPKAHQLKKDENKKVVVVKETSALPLPPPPKIDFNIPEPISKEEFYEEISKVEVEQRKEKKGRNWLSWLWPFGADEEVFPEPEKVEDLHGEKGATKEQRVRNGEKDVIRQAINKKEASNSKEFSKELENMAKSIDASVPSDQNELNSEKAISNAKEIEKEQVSQVINNFSASQMSKRESTEPKTPSDTNINEGSKTQSQISGPIWQWNP